MSAVTMPVPTYVAMVTKSVPRLKFWMMERCSSRAKPRNVHHNVGKVPVNPPIPPITPPSPPTTASASRPPAVMRGRYFTASMSGHHSTRKQPSSALNIWTSSMGRMRTPIGMPTRPPSRNGSSRRQSKPRRTEKAAISCPVSDPNTTRAAARRGSMLHAQTDMAVSP
ncbi:Uncharacterised protein [Bordetella pertussis]|nr:Uncharacterised protein [Bordetella pertussis]